MGIIKNHSEKELKKLCPVIKKIESFGEKMSQLSDEDLKN